MMGIVSKIRTGLVSTKQKCRGHGITNCNIFMFIYGVEHKNAISGMEKALILSDILGEL
jgi:hypothetical protein